MKKFSELEQINEEFKPSEIYKKQNIGGFDILIGRNASANDILTFEIAEDNDIWMHASGVPGSHVVIKSNGETVPNDVIREAAKLAVLNSKGKGKGDIKVVYTKRENVKKDSKHNTGQVSVDYDKSKFITINVI